MCAETFEDWQKLVEIKDQEIAQLNKIKDILQQKVADSNQRIKALQAELDEKRSESEEGIEEAGEVARLREENQQLTDKLAEFEEQDAAGEMSATTGDQGISPVLDEKVNQILDGVNQLLSRIKIASKLPPSKSGQAGAPSAGEAESKEAKPGRSLKPSDILRRQQVEEKPAPAEEEEEEEEVSRPKPSKVRKRVEEEEEAEEEENEEEEEAPTAKKSSGRTKAREAPEPRAAPKEIKEEQKERKKEAAESAGEKVSATNPPGGKIITAEYPADGSIVCPKCGKQNYQEMQDPTVIVAYAPVKKFGRKFYCKSCRCNWRYKTMGAM